MGPIEPTNLARPTPQQRRAISTRDVSVVLSSGAGCGKTHVLTERYLAHLRDDHVEVNQIVAITFTDRAARQMRQRIRRALTQELRAAPTDADAERWSRHLRGLESAPISTIHAFCGNLLRQHAVEAGLDPQFDILEDVLSRNLEEEALTECLQRLLTTPSPEGEDLRELILVYGWRPVVTGVQHLMHAEGTAWDAWLTRPADQIAAGWQQFARTHLLPRYVEHVLRTSPRVIHCLELLGRVPPRPGSKMAGKVRQLLERTPKLAESGDLAATVAELVECAKVGGERANAWPSEEVYGQVKAAFEGFREELPGRMKLFLEEPANLTEAARAGQRFVQVAAEAVRTYRLHKRRNGVVDFQDLLTLTRNLLKEHAAVRERLQRRYRVLLIDELQDTDPVQVELVEALCGGGLAAGKLFAVGDHKQSIYRFRGADVTLFQDLRHRVPHEGRLDLTVNFRSQPAILHFTNALFGHRMPEYEPLAADLPQVNPGPCVEFLWSPRGPRELVNEARKVEADWIARRIAQMTAGESLVLDRQSEERILRPVRQGDVVVLFRALTNVPLYEAALRKYGLDYYLVGGRAFFAQQEIYDLLNLLRALENPQDAVSLAGTLRSPFCCLSDEALFLLNRHAGGLWAGLHDEALCESLPADQREPADRARRSLDRWRGLKDRLPIVRLLGEVFADSGYDAATQFEFLGDRKLANLWKLMDLARTFDRSGLFGLAEFIARLGDLVRTQPREEQAATQPENADVVRLMSIHQAKGLEFPVVVIPDLAAAGGPPHYPVVTWAGLLGSVVRPPADEEPPPFSPFAWELWKAAEAIDEWHEDLRTLYVACTRAQDYLVLSAALPANYRPANAWMMTLAERFDLRTGSCRASDLPPEKIPLVRVTDSRSPPPEPGHRVSERPLAEGRAAELSSLALTALPIRLTGREFLTVRQIEQWLRRGPGALPPSDPAWQFDAEDGSDRTAWAPPGRRLAGWQDADTDRWDRLLRWVLERWDFRDADAWQDLWREVVAANPSREAARVTEWTAQLAAFAHSPTFRLLAEAAVCHRDVEFLTTLAGVGSRPLMIRGVIDFLYRDRRGGWHGLSVTAEAVSPEPQDQDRRCREPGLALAAKAIHQHQGTWPQSMSLYSFPPHVSISLSGQQLQRPEILTGLADQLAMLSACPSFAGGADGVGRPAEPLDRSAGVD